MIAVLDYGIGNVRSVLNAFSHIGTEAILTREPTVVRDARALVLPGVGSFGEGMRRIDQYGLRPVLDQAVASQQPMLGICLGFELLMRSSDEMGLHAGLAYVPLDVRRLQVQERLPHIGWSAVRTADRSLSSSRLLEGLEGEQFYFVHSYGVESIESTYVNATATYGGCELLALIEHGSVFGCQFHPERSGEAGLQLLRNFARVC